MKSTGKGGLGEGMEIDMIRGRLEGWDSEKRRSQTSFAMVSGEKVGIGLTYHLIGCFYAHDCEACVVISSLA